VGFEDTTKNPYLQWSIAGRRLLTAEQLSILDCFFVECEKLLGRRFAEKMGDYRRMRA